jgi:phosphoribosylaminoimidazole-succinocarboxamide synthase
MSRLKELGVPTHLIRPLNMREQLVCAAEVVPVRVTIHNVAVDHFAKRLGLDVDYPLPRPIFEFSYNNRELDYPIVSPYHAEVLEWLRVDEIDDIMAICQRTNDFLSGHFLALGLKLLNFTVEFGRLYQGEYYEESQLILIDELSQDTCSLQDLATGHRLDRTIVDQMGAQVYHRGAQLFGLLDDQADNSVRAFSNEE